MTNEEILAEIERRLTAYFAEQECATDLDNGLNLVSKAIFDLRVVGYSPEWQHG
jgi:hypothetical protein